MSGYTPMTAEDFERHIKLHGCRRCDSMLRAAAAQARDCRDLLTALSEQRIRAETAERTLQEQAEWLKRKLATNDDTECAVDSSSGTPSCLCCGRVGVVKVWLINHPEVYVCEQCKGAERTLQRVREAAKAHIRSLMLMPDDGFRPLQEAEWLRELLEENKHG